MFCGASLLGTKGVTLPLKVFSLCKLGRCAARSPHGEVEHLDTCQEHTIERGMSRHTVWPHAAA